MQEHFWSEAGRKGWKETDAHMVFLGRAFVRLGELTYQNEWTGEKTRPSTEQAEALQKVIARAAASRIIRTYVLDPDTLKYRLIPHTQWRNQAALSARFTRCQIDADDLKSNKAAGDRHGGIYIDVRDIEDLLAMGDPSVVASEKKLLEMGGFVSPYLRFLIHIAMNHPLDEERLLSAKELRLLLRKEWREWRAKISPTGVLPEHAVLTDRLLAPMATILRGEIKRAERQGQAKRSEAKKT